MSNPIERRIAEITRTGNVLAAQLGAVFVVDKRKVRDFRARAAQAIEAGTDETLQAAQPEGRERGPKGAPILHQGEASNG